MQDLKEIDAQQLHNLLRNQEKKAVVLLDVRSPAEAARGGIHGARNLPLHLLPVLGHELEENVELVLYCHSGARSAQGCAFLMTRGYRNVYNLRGGILGWSQIGQPLAPVDSVATNA